MANIQLPLFQKIKTECCGKTIWLKHSRVDPTAWTDEDFRKEYDVDDEMKKITIKDKTFN